MGARFFPLSQAGDVGVGNPFLGGGRLRGIQLAVKLSFQEFLELLKYLSRVWLPTHEFRYAGL